MLYGTETISAYTPRNVSIWMLLAFQAGLLNMGGLLACQSLVSHVTGYATHIALDIHEQQYYGSLFLFFAPLSFLLGAMASGYLIDLRIKLHKDPKYYLVFGAMFGLTLAVFALGVLGYFGTFGEPISYARDYALLALLCFICGMQNASVTLISRSVVRTTHLTGIVTDLGVGLVRVLNRERLGNEVKNEHQANWMRIGIVTLFLLGSICGAPLFNNFGFWAFSAPAFISGILFFSMLYFRKAAPR